jgi:ketosteroid isomerase-like protein
METGYWVGDLLLKAPEDKLKIEFDHKGPFQGEIDIQMHMGTTSELENELLITFSNTICHSVVSFLNITLGEYLVPVTPVQIRALQPGGSTFENSVQMKCVSRPVLEKKQLEECLSNYIAYRQSTDKEEERTMDTAMRRYLSAQNERDVVDKYCDLWESCEFVTYNVKAKGQKVGRIAQALANHISKTGRKISKANVEKLLDIKGLYNVRGQIVHNAVDKPEYIKDKIALLNELALELIRYKLGLPYQGNQTIDKFII